MQDLIQLNAWPVKPALDILLQNKTTKKNIIFATDSCTDLGADFLEKSEMTSTNLLGIDACEIQPRVVKSLEHQASRTKKKWEKEPIWRVLKKIANIISWNLWQMDGFTGTVPLLEREATKVQVSLFDLLPGMNGDTKAEKEKIPCRIYDWRGKCSLEFNSLRK